MKSFTVIALLLFSFTQLLAAPAELGAAAVDSSEEEMGTGNDEHDRKMVVGELIKLETKLDQDIEKNDHYDIRYTLVNLETKVLPRVARLSKKIDATLTNPDQKAGEYKFQRSIIEDITRMMYKAGARNCLSPEETYYENRCMPFGANAEYNPCIGKDQILYDGKNNEGACDCVEDERQLIYYQGECHTQNIQGPCLKGSWLVMNEGIPSCEPVPVNCTADGQHIFWSPDPLKAKPECHQLNQRGPCSIGQIILRDQTGIKCVFPPDPTLEGVKDPASETSTIWDRPTCSLGSNRHQNGRCPVQ